MEQILATHSNKKQIANFLHGENDNGIDILALDYLDYAIYKLRSSSYESLMQPDILLMVRLKIMSSDISLYISINIHLKKHLQMI